MSLFLKIKVSSDVFCRQFWLNAFGNGGVGCQQFLNRLLKGPAFCEFTEFVKRNL